MSILPDAGTEVKGAPPGVQYLLHVPSRQGKLPGFDYAVTACNAHISHLCMFIPNNTSYLFRR